MKKSLIALAVAGAFAAPAFAATSNVDVYGVLNIAVQDTDGASVSPAVLDNTSRIGFKGSEDLGGGMKAIWQIESALGGNGATMGTPTATNGLASRNTFVGLSGGFGTVLAGRHDTPYKLGTASLDPFADTIADANLGRLNGVELTMNAHDARVGNALAYISPTWSGFHFAAAVVYADDVAATDSKESSTDGISLTGVYANGPLFVSLSYQDVMDVGGASADSDAIKLGLGYTLGDAKVGFVYEKVGLDAAGAQDRTSWQINGTYNMGAIALKAAYGTVSDDQFTNGNDQSMWALGVDYNLSKRTTAYFVYGNGDSDRSNAAATFTPAAGNLTAAASIAGDVSGWNIGIKHSF